MARKEIFEMDLDFTNILKNDHSIIITILIKKKSDKTILKKIILPIREIKFAPEFLS